MPISWSPHKFWCHFYSLSLTNILLFVLIFEAFNHRRENLGQRVLHNYFWSSWPLIRCFWELPCQVFFDFLDNGPLFFDDLLRVAIRNSFINQLNHESMEFPHFPIANRNTSLIMAFPQQRILSKINTSKMKLPINHIWKMKFMAWFNLLSVQMLRYEPLPKNNRVVIFSSSLNFRFIWCSSTIRTHTASTLKRANINWR